MARSECLTTLLNPLAERTCCSQVGGSLGDAIIFDGEKREARYFEDLPEDYIHEKYLDYPRLTVRARRGRLSALCVSHSVCVASFVGRAGVLTV